MATSSYAGEIQAIFYGRDASRYLKSILSELLFGNEGVRTNTCVKNDNKDEVCRVHPINAVEKAKRLNSYL